MANPVVIGRIGAPYGLKGFVHVHSFTSPKENIINFPEMLLQKPINDSWQFLHIESIKEHGNNYVAKFVGTNDRNAAAELTNSKLAVDRAALPSLNDPDQYYWVDLIGLEVYNEENNYLGVIADVFATGANDVLVISDSNNQETLIPCVPGEFILNVDDQAKRIKVRWQQDI